MTSLCPVLAGYKLVRSRPYTCLPSICVQNLSAALLFAMVWRLACTVCRSFSDLLYELLFDFPLPLGIDIYLLVSRGTPFLLRYGCLFSPYLSWHASSGPTQFFPFGWYVIPAEHFPQKSLGRNLKIGLPLSPSPNHALLSLTHDLTVSCIGWVQAGEVWP